MIFLDHYVEPEEGVIYKSEKVKLVLNRMEMGVGTLVLTESDVTWVGNAKVKFAYSDLCTHNVSRNVEFYPSECIYAIVKSASEVPGEGHEMEGSTQQSSTSQDVIHMLLVPEDRNAINAIDTTLADRQAIYLIESGQESALEVEFSEEEVDDEEDEEEQEEDVNVEVGENGHGFENGEAEDML